MVTDCLLDIPKHQPKHIARKHSKGVCYFSHWPVAVKAQHEKSIVDTFSIALLSGVIHWKSSQSSIAFFPQPFEIRLFF